jgi:Tfp pilus assembly PilM family ATPase/Tfp pilus assembly protein PilN
LAEQYLGIDIRDEYTALTLVAKTWRGVDIVRSYWFQLYPEQKGEAVEDLFVQELDDFLKIGSVKPKEVLLSLPRQISTVQSFDVPAPDAHALDSMIQLEMDRHFAFPLESMNVSYHVVPVASNQNHVIAAATKREQVEMYLSWLARAGLKVDGVDISLSSQMNLLDQNGELGSKLQAIIDVSSTQADVSLIKGKTLLTSRSMPIPDKEFKKIFFHQDLPESLTDQVTERFSNFLTELLESTLYGCKSLENEESITQIRFFGGGRGTKGLVSALQTQTGVNTDAVLPTFLKKDSPLNFTSSFQMTSLGLALRPALKDPIELNLHLQSRHKAKRNSSWKSTVVLSVMILAAVVGLLLAQTYKNETTLDSLNHQLEEIKPLATQLQKIDQRYVNLSSYTESLNAIERRSPLKLPLLQELSQKLPKDTWVTRISIKQDQVEVQGYSVSASQLIPLLEESDFLKDTQFKGSVTTQALGKRFTVRSTMEPRG